MDGEGTNQNGGNEGVPSASGEGANQPQPGSEGQDRSLMSRSASGGEGDNKANPDSSKAQDDKGKAGDNKQDDPAAKVPDKPEGYDLKFAPETTVDAVLLDGFRKTALELGLTQGQAQKLGSLYEGHMVKAAERFEAEQTKMLLDARKGWEDELAKSPTFEADLGLIQSALRRFGDQELFTLLDQTNLGSHPKMFSFMAKVGKALAEPGLHGERDGGAKSAAKTLYPNMN